MGNARTPTIIPDPIATETSHVIDAFIYKTNRFSELSDLSGKSVTLAVQGPSGVKQVYDGASVGEGHVRFTFSPTHWENPGDFEAQLFIDAVLVWEYAGEFKTQIK